MYKLQAQAINYNYKRDNIDNYDNFDQTMVALEASQSEDFLNRVAHCEMEPGITIEEISPQNLKILLR